MNGESNSESPTDGDATVDDETLLDRYREGDAAAFNALLARHSGPVYNFIFRFVRNEAHANDLLQEVFMRVVKGAREFRRQSKVTTWLYTIARNLCIDEGRKGKFRRGPSLDQSVGNDDDGGATLGDMVADANAQPEARVADGELQPRIMSALAALNPDQREVFLMREVSGLSFQEIAAVVGVSENTAKSRMRYAIERLRKLLEEAGITRDAAI